MAAGCARTWRVVRRWPQICQSIAGTNFIAQEKIHATALSSHRTKVSSPPRFREYDHRIDFTVPPAGHSCSRDPSREIRQNYWNQSRREFGDTGGPAIRRPCDRQGRSPAMGRGPVLRHPRRDHRRDSRNRCDLSRNSGARLAIAPRADRTVQLWPAPENRRRNVGEPLRRARNRSRGPETASCQRLPRCARRFQFAPSFAARRRRAAHRTGRQARGYESRRIRGSYRTGCERTAQCAARLADQAHAARLSWRVGRVANISSLQS